MSVNLKRRAYWKDQVLDRDERKCQICGATEDQIHLVAHHIYSVSEYPEEALNVDNGATLCELHHREYPFSFTGDSTGERWLLWLETYQEHGLSRRIYDDN